MGRHEAFADRAFAVGDSAKGIEIQAGSELPGFGKLAPRVRAAENIRDCGAPDNVCKVWLRFEIGHSVRENVNHPNGFVSSWSTISPCPSIPTASMQDDFRHTAGHYFSRSNEKPKSPSIQVSLSCTMAWGGRAGVATATPASFLMAVPMAINSTRPPPSSAM